MSKVVVMDHPLIEQKIGIIRRKDIIEYCYNCYKNVAGNEKN